MAEFQNVYSIEYISKCREQKVVLFAAASLEEAIARFKDAQRHDEIRSVSYVNTLEQW